MPRVLIATDGSDVAVAAARRGLSLLAPDSEVTVITVVPLIMPVTGIPQAGIGTGFVADSQIIEDAEDARLDSARADVDATVAALGIEATGRVEHGFPGETICDVARGDRFELIVIGSRGAGVLKRVLLGSVTEHVLRHAPCPVLVVREVETEDVSSS